MYLLQPTFPIFATALMLANALPSPSITRRAPADMTETKVLELDVRIILMDSDFSPPTGKVTLTRADTKWNTDEEWLVYDIEGLADRHGKPMRATATTREDGQQIDLEMIDEDALLGYGHDVKKGIHNQRWWMLESKEPYDIRKKKMVEIQLHYVFGDISLGPFDKVTAVPLSEYDDDEEEASDDDEDGVLFFTIPKWIDDTEVCAVTRVNGGKIDPDNVKNYLSKNILLLYGYEKMEEPYRRRWWLVYKCPERKRSFKLESTYGIGPLHEHRP